MKSCPSDMSSEECACAEIMEYHVKAKSQKLSIYWPQQAPKVTAFKHVRNG